MSDKVAIFIPTFGRPHRAAELVEDIRVATTADYRIYFIVEKHDPATIEAISQLDARSIINPGPPTYASCINSAYDQTEEPYFFTGADDVHFHRGWLTAALGCMSDPKIGIVGTLDPLHNSHDHSTHSLVRRTYIEDQSGCLDRSNTVFYPYWHGWVDHELLGIAKVRGAYHYCEDSLVEHHHPGWDWFGRVETGDEKFDATYAKGNSKHREDTRVFLQRCVQWIDSLPNNSSANAGLKKFVSRNKGLRGKIRYCLKEIRAAMRSEAA